MKSPDQSRESARHGRIQSGGAARLAVFLDLAGSFAPAEIAASAAGLCDLHFLVAADADAMLVTVARSLAETTAVEFGDFESCLRAVRVSGATAAITFVDTLCPLVAQVNRELLGGHWPEHWGRKDTQRRMLAGAGLSAVRSALVGSRAELLSFARSAGWPLVLKPADGVGSRDTWLLRDERDLDGPDGPSDPFARPMLAEQFLVGDARASAHLADYVSVEVFRNHRPAAQAEHDQVGTVIVDRLPLVEPLRETGQVMPTTLPPHLRESVAATATRALDALGVTAGTFHVEVKPAKHGSDLIEVNGRLGGFIARGVHYGTGADLGRVALSCLLGRAEDLELSWARCVSVMLFQPPLAARHVSKVPERRLAYRLPGALAVDDIARAGTAVDWRAGTNQAVARLWLSADNHCDLRERILDAAQFLTDKFEFVDAAGAVVPSRAWLDALGGQPQPGYLT